MAHLHYFQRYSQRENVDTNNALLLLSRIQAHDPRKLRVVLEELFAETDAGNSGLMIGAQFSQQRSSSGGSVVDGEIFQGSFRIVVETKRDGSKFGTTQLHAHLAAFKKETIRILLLLAPTQWNGKVPGAQEAGVLVASCTFADLIAACDEAGLREDFAMREIIEDYENFCSESGLLPNDEARMLVVPVGTTLQENLDLSLYYAPNDRFHQKHKYLGLYSQKAVRAVGQVDKIVRADLVGDRIEAHGAAPLTADEQTRIKKAIDGARAHGWNIMSDHSFFMIRRFVPTQFRKTSRMGLSGKRYFDLRILLDLEPKTTIPDVDTVAQELGKRTWE